MATVATRVGLRASKATSRGSAVSGLRFTRLINDVMPTTSSVRRYLSPTRYDKLAANFLSAVALATAVAFWL